MIDIKRLNEKDYVERILVKDPKNKEKTLKKIQDSLELLVVRNITIERIEQDNHEVKKISNKIKYEPENKELKEKVKEIKELTKKKKEHLEDIDNKFKNIIDNLPNPIHEGYIFGLGEEDNQEIFRKNCEYKIEHNFPHHIACEDIDTETGTALAQTRFTVLKHEIATLHRKLGELMIEEHIKNDYVEYNVPNIVNRKALYNTGQLPKFADDLFWVSDELALIPTAEVPLVNMFSKNFLNKGEHIKCVAKTPCFRQEAGGYGKDTAGIIRQHQFEKVEMVEICEPEKSFERLENITKNACKILDLLKLPYRVVELCSGDTGFGALKTYDIEVWIPSQNKYREISSCSNMGDFQAKRAAIKYKDEGKNKYFAHTLNGSGLAIGRTLVALIENNIDKDGNFCLNDDVKKLLNSY